MDTSGPYDFHELPAAYSNKKTGFLIKQHPGDFIVQEELGFEPAGSGDHLYLYIKKQGCTSFHVRELLAQCYNVAPVSIGHSGIKDKHAVTSQWFSIKTDKDAQVAIDALTNKALSIDIVHASRNSKKLRVGSHKLNKFEITLRDVHIPDNTASDFQAKERIDETIVRIRTTGVPNYFGPQRFGANGNNLDKALEMFAGNINPSREKRSIYLSAARSYLFNEMLSQRVENSTWNRYLHGDTLALTGSKSYFSINSSEVEIEAIQKRLGEKDIAIGVPLFTAREERSSRTALGKSLERALRKVNLSTSVRALAAYPRNLALESFESNGEPCFKICFALEPGCFATSVLKELGIFIDASVQRNYLD